jgi:3-dehydroquinate synthase
VRGIDVPLSSGRDYRILIGGGALPSLGAELLAVARSRRAVVVTQPGIAKHWAAAVLESLQAAGFDVSLIEFPAGERHKHLATIARLYERLYNLPGIDRKTTLVALGGGVVGDMVGFVAATYLRGMDYAQVPTTLLAMTDSSVGGKTGVDFRAGKNLIGAFHQPRLVLVDPATLSTLSKREVRSGLAEVIKYGVIREPELLAFVRERAKGLLSGDADALSHIVERSCAIKAEVVCADEREETGLRAILNFGHTIGHALESATNYRRYKHGEAVAIGMMAACAIGEEAGVTPGELTEEIRATLNSVGLPIALPDDIDDETLIELTARDKKASAGRARYVLAHRAGEVALTDVAPETVEAGLNRLRRGGGTLWRQTTA